MNWICHNFVEANGRTYISLERSTMRASFVKSTLPLRTRPLTRWFDFLPLSNRESVLGDDFGRTCLFGHLSLCLVLWNFQFLSEIWNGSIPFDSFLYFHKWDAEKQLISIRLEDALFICTLSPSNLCTTSEYEMTQSTVCFIFINCWRPLKRTKLPPDGDPLSPLSTNRSCNPGKSEHGGADGTSGSTRI